MKFQQPILLNTNQKSGIKCCFASEPHITLAEDHALKLCNSKSDSGTGQQRKV